MSSRTKSAVPAKPLPSDAMRTFVGLIALAAASSLFAQTSAKVDVKVINVDVSVMDAAGKAISNLEPDDFEVLEDNQPQKITNFAWVPGPATGKASAAATTEWP